MQCKNINIYHFSFFHSIFVKYIVINCVDTCVILICCEKKTMKLMNMIEMRRINLIDRIGCDVLWLCLLRFEMCTIKINQ